MSRRTASETRGDGAVCVGCFLFRRKKSDLKKSPPLAVETAAAELRNFVSAPDCRELSVASSSVSCVAAAPELTPLHLDIPYVSASPLSHSNTLAWIERFNTPRASYGPISEAGKAIVAARKDSMRQEHLAAIAHLNTFAKKRASKLPSSQSGSESSKASGQKCAGSSPASSIEAQHQIPALHHMPQAAAAPAAATSGNPLADRPAWTEPPAAMQPTAVPSDSNPYLSSGSMHGDGDWLAGGINSHRNSYHSPSVKASSDLASDNTQIDSSAGQPNTLPVTVSSKPILGDSGQPDNMGMYQASGNPPPAGNSSASFGSHSKPTPASTMRPQAKQQAALPPSASPAAGLSHGVGQSSTMQEHVNHSPQQEAGVQQFANSQLGGQWQSAVAQQPVVTVQPSSAPFCPVTQSQPPTASQGLVAAEQRSAAESRSLNGSQGSFAADRLAEAQTSLESRESSPDESLVAEGWIVAGTIMMSNRTNGASTSVSPRDVKSSRHVMSSAASSNSSKDTASAVSASTNVPLSQDELIALNEELEVLKEKPRSQMTSQELAKYLDIKIKLARAGGLSRRSSLSRAPQTATQLAIPTESGVLQDTSLSVKQSLTSNASSNSADRASVPGKVSPRSAVAPRQTLKKGSTQENKPRQPSAPRSNVPRPTNSLPARPRRGAENRPAPDVYSQHIPAYMKSTASNKAKDAREAQAKLAAQRSVLTEKKWNRA